MTTKTNMTLETLFARMVRATLQLFLLLSLFPLLVPAAQASTLQTHSYTYDTLGRMVTDTDANSQTTSYTYDQNGNRLSATDPLGRVTSYSYDSLDRLVTVTNPLSGVTSYVYDPLDHLVTVTDPLGHSTSYTYNGLDQLLSQSSPDTGSTSFTYGDGANVVTQRTNAASQNTQITYDALNRPGTITYADGRVVTYTWDQGTNGAGRLTSVSDTDSTLNWTYDNLGHILSRTQAQAVIATSSGSITVSYPLLYQYNSQGQLTQITYPSGMVVSYTYDSQGRVESLSQNGSAILNNIAYRPFGGIAGWTWANGTTHQVTYDQNGNPSTMSVGNDSLVFSYDNVQRLISSEYVSNSATQNYSYDNLDRLYSYSGLGSTHAWTYDANGNRLTHSAGSATDNYVLASSSNRLASLTPAGQGTHTYSYNAQGQVVYDGSNTYTYDARERLTVVANSVGGTHYLINPLGQRISKTHGGNTLANYLYDDAGHLIAETNGSGIVATEYLYLGDTPVATVAGSSNGTILTNISNTAAYWTLAPGEPTPTAPTNSNNPDGVYQYTGADPYGQITWDSSQSVCPQACFKISDISTGSSSTAWPNVHGTVLYTTQSVRFHYELETTTTAPGGYRYLMAGIQNSSTLASGLARKAYITFSGSSAYAQYIDGTNIGSDGVTVNETTVNLNYPIQDNKGYVVEIDSTPTQATLYLFPQGGTRAQGVSYPVSFTWPGTGTSQQHYAMLLGQAYAGSSTVSTAMYLSNVTISQLGGRSLYNIHPDQLGTPRQITTSDSSNSLVWRWDSEPFGSAQPNQDPQSTGTPFVFNLRFPGQYYDAESGLNHNGWRDYNASTGSYPESDPIGLGGGQLSTYAYVGGHPTLGVDPLGLMEVNCPPGEEEECGANRLPSPGGGGSPEERAILAGEDAAAVGEKAGADEGKCPANAAKKIPNPFGSRGGPAHANRIGRRIEELKNVGHKHIGGGDLPEESVPTPGGDKSSRRPDITTEAPDGSIYRENVGRSTSDSSPIARERRALDDLQSATGSRPGYTPYDR